jgi:uncharacterized protein
MSEENDRYIELLRTAGCNRSVIRHCSVVAATAAALSAESSFFDHDLVEAGALLHDLGRSVTHGIGHAQAGADLCRSLGLDEEIARIVECHTGAGLTADECIQLGLLPIDCMPSTPEGALVACADNLVMGEEVITIEERLDKAYALSRKVRMRMYRQHQYLQMLR